MNRIERRDSEEKKGEEMKNQPMKNEQVSFNEQIRYRVRREKKKSLSFFLFFSCSKVIDDEGVSYLAILIYDLKKKNETKAIYIHLFHYIIRVSMYNYPIWFSSRTNHAIAYEQNTFIIDDRSYYNPFVVGEGNGE